MSNPKKKDKSSIEDEQTDSITNVMSEFADAISQNILERDVSHAETFELYAHQLRTQLHSNGNIFKNRFSEGYRVLLQQLEQKE